MLSPTLPWKLMWVTCYPFLAPLSPFSDHTWPGLTDLARLHLLTLPLQPSSEGHFLSEAEMSIRPSFQETGELTQLFNSAFRSHAVTHHRKVFPLETKTNNLRVLFRSQGTLPKALWR